MEFNAYQKESRETALYPGAGNNFVYPVLGLAGETGEVAEKVKKLLRDEEAVSVQDISPEKKAELEKEIGDVLWYMAQLATELDLSLNVIAEKNLKKIFSRRDRKVLHGEGDNR